jgi:capsule polysaccharide export protein KpsE/RkpR
MTALAIMQARLTGRKILNKSDEFVNDFARVAGLMYEKDLSGDKDRHKLFLFIPHSDLAGLKELSEVEAPWVKDAISDIVSWQASISQKINIMLGEMKPLIQELRNRFDAIKKTMWSA